MRRTSPIHSLLSPEIQLLVQWLKPPDLPHMQEIREHFNCGAKLKP
jgi:hypothetical protein